MALDTEYMKMAFAIDKRRLVALGDAASKLQGYNEGALTLYNEAVGDRPRGHCIGKNFLSCTQPFLKSAMLAAATLDGAACPYLGVTSIDPPLPSTRDFRAPSQIGDFLLALLHALEKVRVRDKPRGKHEAMKNALSACTPAFVSLVERLDLTFQNMPKKQR